jgi:hypothetical protein
MVFMLLKTIITILYQNTIKKSSAILRFEIYSKFPFLEGVAGFA